MKSVYAFRARTSSSEARALIVDALFPQIQNTEERDRLQAHDALTILKFLRGSVPGGTYDKLVRAMLQIDRTGGLGWTYDTLFPELAEPPTPKTVPCTCLNCTNPDHIDDPV